MNQLPLSGVESWTFRSVLVELGLRQLSIKLIPIMRMTISNEVKSGAFQVKPYIWVYITISPDWCKTPSNEIVSFYRLQRAEESLDLFEQMHFSAGDIQFSETWLHHFPSEDQKKVKLLLDLRRWNSLLVENHAEMRLIHIFVGWEADQYFAEPFDPRTNLDIFFLQTRFL